MPSTYVNWGASRVKLTWKSNIPMPEKRLLSSAHGFCFHEGKLLMVYLNDRGWDFPGGHLEKGESPEDCFKREAMEEGYVSGECTYLGCLKIDHHENPVWDENSPYPKVGYQVFYKMDINAFHPFKGRYESSQRTLINANEVTTYYKGWHQIYQAILEDALLMDNKGGMT